MSIVQNFFEETLDENGCLKDIAVHWPENFNFGYDVVDVMAQETPEKRALVWCNTENEEHVFTFADIRRESNRAANALLAAGIRRGDRVMLALKRHYEYWFLCVALHKIGAVMIPMTHMLTASDFAYRFAAARPKAIITAADEGVMGSILAGEAQAGASMLRWCWGKRHPSFRDIEEEMEASSPQLGRIHTLATDPMIIYFTSGTTGYPKGVIHDFSYPLAHIVTAKYWQQAEEDGLHFTVAETGWAKASWGKIYGQWLVGAAVMVYDFDNFEPKQLASVINKYGVTSFCAPPTVYRYLTRKDAPPVPSVKHAVTAGEYLSPEVFDKFRQQTGLTLREGYGQTETTLLLANLRDENSRAGSLGRPSPMYHIELLGKDGKPVPDGEIGEVCIVPKDGKRPLGVFCAYLDNEERYQEVWRGGVYHTGDAVWRDEDGYYWFHGRFDDIIKSGGFRIGPYEVENVLMKHPAVAECSVIGVPDKLRGQAIKAVIVPAPGYEPSRQLDKEIREFCNSELAEYKWVRLIEFVDEMPKTISGKIRKARLREQNAQTA